MATEQQPDRTESHATTPRLSGPLFRCVKLAAVGLFVLLGWRAYWMRSHPSAASAQIATEGEPAQRIAAIRDLERFGPEDPEVAIPALLGCLEDKDEKIRSAAASSLVMVIRGAGQSGAAAADVRKAMAGLFNCSMDARPGVRAAGLQSLWMIVSLWEGPATVIDASAVEQALFHAAGDPEEIVRLAAVRGMGSIGPKLADEPPQVLALALEDSSGQVRAAAVEALAAFRTGLPRILPDLVRSFETARPDARASYAAVIDRIRPRAFKADAVPALASILISPDDEIRCLAAEALGAFGDNANHAVPALVSSMTRPVHESKTPTIQEKQTDPVLAASSALLRITPGSPFVIQRAPPIDPESFSTLAKLLPSATPPVRANIAKVLGRFETRPEMVPILATAVRDPDAAVRAAALQALHDIGDRMPFVPPETVKAALEDASPRVRFWAAAAVGHAGRGIDPYITVLLRHAEHDPDSEVRSVCADELENSIKAAALTSAVVPVLTRALESPDVQVRFAVCGLLGRMGRASEPAIPAIIRLLKQAADAEAKAKGAGMVPNQVWRAAQALGSIAPGTPQAQAAATALKEALRSGQVRGAARAVIDALACFGPLARDASPLLQELEQDPIPEIRASASNALKKLGDAK
jgi:HEAT repeat protein